MLLEHLGVLSTAQDLVVGTAVSENVINLGAVANVGFGQLWLAIETETAETGADTDTYVFDLVVATAAGLGTYRSVCQVSINGADPRIAAVNRNIAVMEIGQMIADVMDATYYFLGLRSTLANVGGTAAVSINAAMSPSRPRTRDNVQVTRSNVTIPS